MTSNANLHRLIQRIADLEFTLASIVDQTEALKAENESMKARLAALPTTIVGEHAGAAIQGETSA